MFSFFFFFFSNGGKCYRNCDNRVVINQTMGSLGSFKGSGVTDTHIHCLWIISDGDIHKIENEGVYDTTTVTFTIDDIATECGKVSFDKIYSSRVRGQVATTYAYR